MRFALGVALIIFPFALVFTALTLTGHAAVAWGLASGIFFSLLIVACICGGIEIILRAKR